MGTYFNGVNCDIYIGKGAGKMLLNDIQNAKKSIKIISPYLSPFLISELINLENKNIEIQLITTDGIEDFYGNYEKNIHKLIRQHKSIDIDAENMRNKWIDLTKILIYIIFGGIAIEILFAYFLRDIKVIFGIIPIIIVFLIHNLYKIKIKNKKIYSYYYSQLFPFKVYMSPESTPLSDTFIHGKIYLIDESIAYLGSLNFTNSGTKHNYETRIKTTDKNAVNKINEEIYDLFNFANLPERDIQMWGSQLYEEPLN
jgi:phosphatidylserine/phosphatidylglycerophosphate/cardiolipin synthase-like enzyme